MHSTFVTDHSHTESCNSRETITMVPTTLCTCYMYDAVSFYTFATTTTNGDVDIIFTTMPPASLPLKANTW